MATQQPIDSHGTGQNILLIAIIIVLMYIVLDIFGFIPEMKKGGRRKRRGGTNGDKSHEDKSGDRTEARIILFCRILWFALALFVIIFPIWK